MKTYKRRLILEQLEERIVLDAAVADTKAVDTHQDVAAPDVHPAQPAAVAAPAAAPLVHTEPLQQAFAPANDIVVPAAKPIIHNGSFEHDYQGWKLTDNPIIPTGSYFPWLSAWGITTGTVPEGKFNSMNDPKNVTNPQNDFADHYGPAWGTAGTPIIAPGIQDIKFTPTDGTHVAFAAQNYNSNMTAEQTILLPKDAVTIEADMLYKNYWGGGFFDDHDPAQGNKLDQFLAITITDLAGNVTYLAKTGDPAAQKNLTEQEIPMTHFSFDVTKFAGQKVTLGIEVSAERTLLVAGFDNFFVTVPAAVQIAGVSATPAISQILVTTQDLVTAPLMDANIHWVKPLESTPWAPLDDQEEHKKLFSV
jgi:hypothetical protein